MLAGAGNLINPLPKEIAIEMFESAQVAKVNYVKIPSFDSKDKTEIKAGEVLSYLRSLVKELEFMTFGFEKQRLSKLISKLHRYLKLNVALYAQRCSSEVKDPEEIKDANSADSLELLGKGKVLGRWFDF
mmetsp:Transcript_19535/g.14244  ORF Transcript_19535/g.14244 Transcript_19535/m.14244 type:complete len:130 (-) Transcript_19535:552-941(-)